MNTQPINLIFRFLQNRSVVVINLFYKKKVISGIIIGFDEFMNLVVDDACEILLNSEQIKIGRILVRGDSILLIYENFSIKNN
mmetsp:Transcript_1486/g.2416  ORF Transcript_1486/g.2416 Transcript_1486/m.2416 type:complete len:83 (+) Transcript_1486:27-275(+)